MMMGVLLMSLLQFIEDRLDIRINLQKELAASLLKGFVRCLLGLWSCGVMGSLTGCNKLRIILNLLHVRFELLTLRFGQYGQFYFLVMPVPLVAGIRTLRGAGIRILLILSLHARNGNQG